MIVQCGFLIQLRPAPAGEVLLHDLQIIEAPIQPLGFYACGEIAGATFSVVDLEGIPLRTEITATGGPLVG